MGSPKNLLCVEHNCARRGGRGEGKTDDFLENRHVFVLCLSFLLSFCCHLFVLSGRAAHPIPCLVTQSPSLLKRALTALNVPIHNGDCSMCQSIRNNCHSWKRGSSLKKAIVSSADAGSCLWVGMPEQCLPSMFFRIRTCSNYTI